MQEKVNESQKLDSISNKIVTGLNKDIGIDRHDSLYVAEEVITWLQDDKREETKSITPKDWLIIAKIKEQQLSLMIAESTNIITGTSVIQPSSKTFMLNLPLEGIINV